MYCKVLEGITGRYWKEMQVLEGTGRYWKVVWYGRYWGTGRYLKVLEGTVEWKVLGHWKVLRYC